MSRSRRRVTLVFNLARDADASQGRHQHEIAAGDADVGRKRRAFRANAFLDDLDKHFIAAAQDILDRRLETGPPAKMMVAAGLRAGILDAFLELIADGGIRGALRLAARLRRPHRLVRIEPALAEVLGFDVADVQEPVAADAEIDKGRLDAGLQIDDDSLVDVSDVVVLPGSFDVQLLEDSILNNRDPAFFRLRDVDQHFLFHAATFLFGNTDQYAVDASFGGGAVWKRSGSCADLHGGAAKVKAPAFEVVQPEDGQDIARPDAAVDIHPQPHAQHAFVNGQLQEKRAHVDRRAICSIDHPRVGGQQALDSLGQRGVARRGNLGLIGCALDLSFSTAVGEDFDGAEREPRRSMRRQSSPQFFPVVPFGQLDFHHFIDSLDSNRQGQRERHPRFWMKPLAETQRQPCAAEQPLHAPHKVAVSNEPQVSLLAKNGYVLVIEPFVRLSPPLPLPAGNSK